MDRCSVDDAFLYTHSLFGGLTVEELCLIKSCFKEEEYAPGEAILRQGDSNDRVFFITTGSVEIVKHAQDEHSPDRHISTLEAGDTFGEMELIDIQPCAASAIATSEVVVLTFTGYDLYRLSKTHLKTYSMIIMNLAREISRRLRKTDETLAYLLYTKDRG